jgi:hypothetical protein
VLTLPVCAPNLRRNREGRQRSKNRVETNDIGSGGAYVGNWGWVAFRTCSSADQETVQLPLFQHPAPGNWIMALSGVIGRMMRRISNISWEKIKGKKNAKCGQIRTAIPYDKNRRKKSAAPKGKKTKKEPTLLRSRISRTRSMNVSVTLLPNLADVSTNRHPSFSAIPWPSVCACAFACACACM